MTYRTPPNALDVISESLFETEEIEDVPRETVRALFEVARVHEGDVVIIAPDMGVWAARLVNPEHLRVGDLPLLQVYQEN